MTRHHASAALMALAALSPLTALAAAETGPHRQAVQFANGASSAQLRGTIRGDGDVDYTINARAGQTLAVNLQSSNASLYFNINPPSAANVSMFIGNLQGVEAKVMLPADGTYVVRVYLMRNAARRKESAAYTLDVAVTGQALAPLPASQDAQVAGTRFHATAAVPCQTPGAEAGARCNAVAPAADHAGIAAGATARPRLNCAAPTGWSATCCSSRANRWHTTRRSR